VINLQDTEITLICLGNAEFTVLSTNSVNDELKNEILNKAFPSGSRWKLYTGVRSIAFFPLQTIKDKFALVYSVVIRTIDMPIVSFVEVTDVYHSKVLLSHGLRGIENSFLRKLGSFLEINERLGCDLKENIVSYKSYSECKSNKTIFKQLKLSQTLIISPYENPCQWIEVEAMIIKNAISCNKTKISSFRSFNLFPETEFKFQGLVRE